MKQLCVISAPPDTYSGYGARARDFILETLSKQFTSSKKMNGILK